MSKKISVSASALMLILTLTACGDRSEEAHTVQTDATSAEPIQEPSSTNQNEESDKKSNDSSSEENTGAPSTNPTQVPDGTQGERNKFELPNTHDSDGFQTPDLMVSEPEDSSNQPTGIKTDSPVLIAPSVESLSPLIDEPSMSSETISNREAPAPLISPVADSPPAPLESQEAELKRLKNELDDLGFPLATWDENQLNSYELKLTIVETIEMQLDEVNEDNLRFIANRRLMLEEARANQQDKPVVTENIEAGSLTMSPEQTMAKIFNLVKTRTELATGLEQPDTSWTLEKAQQQKHLLSEIASLTDQQLQLINGLSDSVNTTELKASFENQKKQEDEMMSSINAFITN